MGSVRGLLCPLLRTWAARLQAVGPDADELIQEVLVAVVRSIPKFQYEAGGRFRGWMWTVTKNKWRELLRRRVRAGRAPVEGDWFTRLQERWLKPVPATAGPESASSNK